MAKKKRKPGQPTKYDEKLHVAITRELALLGKTNEEIAEHFHVNPDTIHQWMRRHKKFSDALKDGREFADKRVARSLYERACGYSHKAVKIFQYQGQEVIVPYTEHYPPDPVSCIFWLKNRQKKTWRDHPLEVDPQDAPKLVEEFAKMVSAAGSGQATRGHKTVPATAGEIQDGARGPEVVQDGDRKENARG